MGVGSSFNVGPFMKAIPTSFALPFSPAIKRRGFEFPAPLKGAV